MSTQDTSKGGAPDAKPGEAGEEQRAWERGKAWTREEYRKATERKAAQPDNPRKVGGEGSSPDGHA